MPSGTPLRGRRQVVVGRQRLAAVLTTTRRAASSSGGQGPRGQWRSSWRRPRGGRRGHQTTPPLMTELLGRAAAEGARNERVRDRRTRSRNHMQAPPALDQGLMLLQNHSGLPAEAQPSDRDPGLRRQCYASSRGTSRSGRRRRPASRTRASGRGAARGRPRSGGSGRGGRRGRRGQLTATASVVLAAVPVRL